MTYKLLVLSIAYHFITQSRHVHKLSIKTLKVKQRVIIAVCRELKYGYARRRTTSSNAKTFLIMKEETHTGIVHLKCWAWHILVVLTGYFRKRLLEFTVLT